MTDPLGISQFCFTETLDFPRVEVEKNIGRENKNSGDENASSLR